MEYAITCIVATSLAWVVARILYTNTSIYWQLGVTLLFATTLPAFAYYGIVGSKSAITPVSLLVAIVVSGGTLIGISLLLRKKDQKVASSIRDRQTSTSENERKSATLFRPRLGSKLQLTGVVILIFLPLANSILMPLFAWDGWEYWVLRAKVILASDGLKDYVRAMTESYPPTVSYQMAAASLWRGYIDTSGIGVVHFAMYGGVLLCVVGFFEDCFESRSLGLLGVCLIAFTPLLQSHLSVVGYADFPLCAVITLATMSGFRACRTPSKTYLFAAIIFCLILPLFKVPGFLWAGIIFSSGILAFVYHARSVRGWLTLFGIGVVSFAALWLEAKRRGYSYSLYGLSQTPNLDWYSLGWAHLASSFNILFLILLVTLFCSIAFNAHPKRHVTFALAFLVSTIGAFLLIVTYTNWPAYWNDNGTIGRATLHVAPSITIMCITLWCSLSGVEDRKPTPAPSTQLT